MCRRTGKKLARPRLGVEPAVVYHVALWVAGFTLMLDGVYVEFLPENVAPIVVFTLMFCLLAFTLNLLAQKRTIGRYFVVCAVLDGDGTY